MNEQNQRDSIMSMARGAFEERDNWRDSSLHKWIENQFSAGGDGHE